MTADIKVRGVLLDLGGVVFVGNSLLPGAGAALARLRAAGLLLCFLTNTTWRSVRRLVADLARAGLETDPGDVLTRAQLARQRLAEEQLTPHLMVRASLKEEFAGLPPGEREAVVVGDAGERFTPAALNAAYRKLEGGALFPALAENRSFRDSDGGLTLESPPTLIAGDLAAAADWIPDRAVP